jgi:hypothetical protein
MSEGKRDSRAIADYSKRRHALQKIVDVSVACGGTTVSKRMEVRMPEKETLERARKDAKEGKSPSNAGGRRNKESRVV